jgi:hypothetical protein
VSRIAVLIISTVLGIVLVDEWIVAPRKFGVFGKQIDVFCE